MAPIKLTYLNFRGRAELLRFILAQAKVDFEDCRLEPEKWAEEMPGVGFGVAVLEYDGQVYQHNKAIALFLADKFGLGGSSTDESKEITDILNITESVWDKMSGIFWEKDETKKEEAKKELSETLPATLKNLEDRVVGSGKGWIVGEKVTCADFAVAVLLDPLSKYKPEIIQTFTALANLKKAVEELPNIAKWIESRPSTSH